MDGAPAFYCLACEDILIENYEMRVWHYLCKTPDIPDPMVVWVFNRITMTVLCDRSKQDGPEIKFTGEGARDSTRVFHDSPHLLVVPNLAQGTAYHTDLTGRVLAGSNTFGGGYLCLGDGFAPYDFSAVHLLCNYNANADLGWRGGGLSIETPIQNNQRTVTSWPTTSGRNVRVPQQISDFFNHS